MEYLYGTREHSEDPIIKGSWESDRRVCFVLFQWEGKGGGDAASTIVWVESLEKKIVGTI